MAAIRGSVSEPVDQLGQISDPAATFKNPAQAEFVRGLVKGISDAFRTFVSNERAVPYFFLLSPNGQAWKITVSDTGAITSEPARSSTRG